MAKITFEQIRNALEPFIVEIDSLRAEELQTEAAIQSGHYRMTHVEDTLKPKRASLQAEMDVQAREAQGAVERLLSDYLETARREDQLRPEDMTEDAALFQSGIELREQDLKDILERNAGNRTMTQLALRYAETHGIRLGMEYSSAMAEASALAEAVRGTMQMYVTNWLRTDRSREMLSALFGQPDNH